MGCAMILMHHINNNITNFKPVIWRNLFILKGGGKIAGDFFIFEHIGKARFDIIGMFCAGIYRHFYTVWKEKGSQIIKASNMVTMCMGNQHGVQFFKAMRVKAGCRISGPASTKMVVVSVESRSAHPGGDFLAQRVAFTPAYAAKTGTPTDVPQPNIVQLMETSCGISFPF